MSTLSKSILILIGSIICYFVLMDMQNDINKKCDAKGGKVVLVYKLLKCKLPDGTYVKIDGKYP